MAIRDEKNVKIIQQWLSEQRGHEELKQDDGGYTGIWGKKTIKAFEDEMKKVQKEAGLPETGKYDDATRAQLEKTKGKEFVGTLDALKKEGILNFKAPEAPATEATKQTPEDPESEDTESEEPENEPEDTDPETPEVTDEPKKRTAEDVRNEQESLIHRGEGGYDKEAEAIAVLPETITIKDKSDVWHKIKIEDALRDDPGVQGDFGKHKDGTPVKTSEKVKESEGLKDAAEKWIDLEKEAKKLEAENPEPESTPAPVSAQEAVAEEQRKMNNTPKP